MPPEEADKQPTEQERKIVLDWIGGMKRRTPKDPGPFVIRRLNKTEYGNTLHDLFGVDPNIARDLPDEVIGAAYTNSLSPLLVEQYLSVANEVLDRTFAPRVRRRPIFSGDCAAIFRPLAKTPKPPRGKPHGRWPGSRIVGRLQTRRSTCCSGCLRWRRKTPSPTPRPCG